MHQIQKKKLSYKVRHLGTLSSNPNNEYSEISRFGSGFSTSLEKSRSKKYSDVPSNYLYSNVDLGNSEMIPGSDKDDDAITVKTDNSQSDRALKSFEEKDSSQVSFSFQSGS
jgi:hypothetical protein